MKSRLSPFVMASLLGLSFVWGSSMAVIKVGSYDMAPLFMAGMRSILATVCLYCWMRYKGIALFPDKKLWGHGFAVGFLFALEFGLLYNALEHTMASRAYILSYTAPFFVALMAHFFLKNDRLDFSKAGGLVLAFCGIVVLFIKEPGQVKAAVFSGDILALGAAVSWAATTVYLKRFLVKTAQPIQTLFYQLFFSGPLLLLMSYFWEDPMLYKVSWPGMSALVFQAVVIAFLSYLVWFEFIHRYPVSLMHAFSFVTPIFGVFFSGFLFLGEPLDYKIIVALVLVTLGLALVNRMPKKGKA